MAGKKDAPKLKVVPNQIAMRCRAEQERALVDAVAAFGKLEEQPSSRLYILHLATGGRAHAARDAIADLQQRQIIEFATPVLRDAETGLRQILTDEIVLRLKRDVPQKRTLDSLTAQHGLEVGRRNEFEPTQYIVKVPHASGTETLDIARSLDESADVEFASPNFLTDIKR